MVFTEAHKRYPEKMFEDLGVNPHFYERFVRPMIIEIKGNVCELCGSIRFLDIHHSDMEVLNIPTLKLLCKKCHVKEH